MKSASALTLSCLVVACTPSLDWRETRPEGADVVAMFPCKPDRHARPIALAGATTRMEMLVCSAGGATFAISFADLPDPASVATAMAELQAKVLGNIRGTASQTQPARVSGMTPNSLARRLTMAGQLPDGAAVQEQAVFFVKGLRVFQASIIGPRLPPDTAETFFAGLKLPS